ncbi:MAG: protein phosphatase 2C domain-containing protein [Gordonia sp. (in: high G+C Gram-positive bacteria)]
MTLVLRYIARSDRGLVRSNNEDSFYAGPRLLALADGMGGHAAGEVASQLVIEAMRTLDDDEPGGDLLAALDQATLGGNAAIAEQVARSPELDGMGTTLTAILFAGNRIGLCHIGDSRGYLYRDSELTQITRDDTFVQTLVEEGQITPEQAHTHPQRSLIMRALTGTPVEPTLTVREARAGDRYLLCSDGLSDVVTEDTIAEALGSIADEKHCANRLIELALRGGGPDNVTVVLADVVDTSYGDSRPLVGGAAGGQDESYTPDPATAAGRAAALRPRAPEPQRPSILTDDEIDTNRQNRWSHWLFVAVVALVIAALIGGFFVTRALLRSTYYVGEHSGAVMIFQGSPDKILFFSSSTQAEKVCVTHTDTATPSVSFAAVGDNGTCRQLALSDLDSLSASTVRTFGISKIDLDDAHNRIRGLGFLPLCHPAATSTTQTLAPVGGATTPHTSERSPAPGPTTLPFDDGPCREP